MVEIRYVCRRQVDIGWGAKEVGGSVDKTWWVMLKVALLQNCWSEWLHRQSEVPYRFSTEHESMNMSAGDESQITIPG